MRFFLFISLLFAFNILGYSQEKKPSHIQRAFASPKIDGILIEAIWKNSEEAKDFIQFRPEMSLKVSIEIKTIVKVI